jgi:hypothetical protein
MSTSSDLKVMGYQCEGLTDASARQEIYPRSFHSLFSAYDDIRIPIFQRTYCWTDAQLWKWWRDVSLANPQGQTEHNLHGHGVGKAVFKRVKETGALACVDGQQRMTTTMLLLAAIRDHALECHLSAPEPLQEKYQDVIDELDGFLFSDVAAMRDWVGTVAEQVLASSKGTAWAWSDYYQDGEVFAFSRLCPSFIDRASYFREVLLGAVENRIAKSDHSIRCTGTNDSSEVVGNNTVTRQRAAKAYFDSCLSELGDNAASTDNATCSGTVGAEAAAAVAAVGGGVDGERGVVVAGAAMGMAAKIRPSELRSLCHKSLHGLYLMYVEIMNEVALPQVFQWLQEKSLTGMGALLYNPSRGVSFEACDMVRNTLLATFTGMHGAGREEEMYRQLWLIPVEMRVNQRNTSDGTVTGIGLNDRGRKRQRAMETMTTHWASASAGGSVRRRRRKSQTGTTASVGVGTGVGTGVGATASADAADAAAAAAGGAGMDDVFRSFVDAWDLGEIGYRPPGYPGIKPQQQQQQQHGNTTDMPPPPPLTGTVAEVGVNEEEEAEVGGGAVAGGEAGAGAEAEVGLSAEERMALRAQQHKEYKEQQAWMQFGYIPGRFIGAAERQILGMLAQVQQHMPAMMTKIAGSMPPMLLYGRVHSCFEAIQLHVRAAAAEEEEAEAVHATEEEDGRMAVSAVPEEAGKQGQGHGHEPEADGDADAVRASAARLLLQALASHINQNYENRG